MCDRCTGRTQPRTTPLHGRCDHITTGACHRALAPPLSRWILLRPQDDASCHLRGSRGAHRSSEPVVRVCGAEIPRRRVGQPASHEGAWWRAGEHGIRSSGGAEEGPHLVHLTDVPNSFTPTAPGACRSRSMDVHGEVHDDRAVGDGQLRRHEVRRRRSSTLRGVAHAHRQQLNAASAMRCAAQQARPQSRMAHPISTVQGTEKNSAGERHGCAWMGEASWAAP